MAVEPRDLFNLVEDDVRELVEAEKSYGDSWRKRGGTGAFMMLARKWDRIENQRGLRHIRHNIKRSN